MISVCCIYTDTPGGHTIISTLLFCVARGSACSCRLASCKEFCFCHLTCLLHSYGYISSNLPPFFRIYKTTFDMNGCADCYF